MADVETLWVMQFHGKMGVPAPEAPRLLSQDVFDFRLKFLHEELQEFHDACVDGDLVAAWDALLDLVYVAKGTALLMGLGPREWYEGMLAVQTANMLKERVPSAEASKRGHAYDVCKPPGWVGPEERLAQLIEKAGGDD